MLALALKIPKIWRAKEHIAFVWCPLWETSAIIQMSLILPESNFWAAFRPLWSRVLQEEVLSFQVTAGITSLIEGTTKPAFTWSTGISRVYGYVPVFTILNQNITNQSSATWKLREEDGRFVYIGWNTFLRATAVPAGTAVARISYGDSVCPSVRPSGVSRSGAEPSPGEIETRKNSWVIFGLSLGACALNLKSVALCLKKNVPTLKRYSSKLQGAI